MFPKGLVVEISRPLDFFWTSAMPSLWLCTRSRAAPASVIS